MTELTKDQLLERIVNALPDPVILKDLQTDREGDAVRFTWQGKRYRVTTGLNVEEVENGLLCGSPAARTLQQTLRRGTRQATAPTARAPRRRIGARGRR